MFRNAITSGRGEMSWGRLVWLSNRDLADVDATVGYVEIAPRAANPNHRHHTCSETLFVLEGEIDHLVGDETVHLRSGDVLVVPAGMVHGASNMGDTPARMVVVYDTGSRDFEAIK